MTISLNYPDHDVNLLKRIAQQISNATQMSDILNETVAFVGDLLKCDACAIYLVEDENLILRASSSGQTSAFRTHAKTKYNWERNGELVQTVVISQGAFRDPRFGVFNKSSEVSSEAFLSAPMRRGSRVVGFINAENQIPYRYSEREVGIISTVGFLVGTRVEIIRLSRENASLSSRLDSYGDIECATRILQADFNLDQREAYLLLQRESRQRRKPMSEVAAAIVLGDRLKNPSAHEVTARRMTPEHPESLS